MREPEFFLDTSICIHVFAAVPEILRVRIEQADRGSLAISSIVLAELAIGLERRGAERVQQLERLLHVVQVLPFDDHAARIYGRLPFQRASFDRLIAAHALAADLTLVTANAADFDKFTGLRVEDWTQA